MVDHDWSLLERHLLKEEVLEEGQSLSDLPPAQVRVLKKFWEENRIDPLTGIGNRRALDDAVNSAFRHNQNLPEDNPYGLNILFMDGDGVKKINDTVSYEAGDAYLLEIVNGIMDVRPRRDEIYRRGGDEFVNMFEGTEEEGKTTAMQILETLQGKSVETPSGPFDVSVSIGLSYLKPSSTYEESKDCLSLAESAMKHAKWGGQDPQNPDSVKIGNRIITMQQYLAIT